MEEVMVTHEPTFVTGKNGNVVIMSEEDYRSMQETFIYVLFQDERKNH